MWSSYSPPEPAISYLYDAFTVWQSCLFTTYGLAWSAMSGSVTMLHLTVRLKMRSLGNGQSSRISAGDVYTNGLG